jgi:hypothetical protein
MYGKRVESQARQTQRRYGMKRSAFFLTVLLLLATRPALADCYEYTIIDYQVTTWWDGTQTVMILGMETFGYCDAVAGGGDPGGGGPGGGSDGGGYAPLPATVSVSSVDTTDPFNPIVGIDVTANPNSDPVTTVILEVNGVVADYMSYAGTARYQFHMPSIGSFADGNVVLAGKACNESTGACGWGASSMMRYTPSPATTSAIMGVSWQEEDEGSEESPGLVTRHKNFTHSLRQVYATTTFTCQETGENSRRQVKETIAVISGTDPMPMWSASAQTSGTLNSAGYLLTSGAESMACGYPTLCSTKTGSSASTFGYMPSVHEAINSFVIDGVGALYNNGSLDISF